MYWKDPLFSMALCALQTCGRDQRLVLGPCQEATSRPGGEGTQGNEGACASADLWYVRVVVCVLYVGRVRFPCPACVTSVCVS